MKACRWGKQPRNSAKPSETQEKQAALSQIPGRCQKESGAPGTVWLRKHNAAINPHTCTLPAPPRWVRQQHRRGLSPEAAQCRGVQEGAPNPQKSCWDPGMSQSAGPSFPSQAPIPQELAEAEGHSPLLTTKADLLLKSHREYSYRSREKEISISCVGLRLVKHADHHSLHTACPLGCTRDHCCNAAALRERPWGGHRPRQSCSFSSRPQKCGNEHRLLPDSLQNAAWVVQ